MLQTRFRIIWPGGFREEEFKKSANQKQESPVVAIFVNGSGRNQQSLQMTFHRCFLPSFGSFSQVVSEEKNFLNRPIRNKSHLWWPFLLTDRNELSNLYKDLQQMVPTKFQFIWLRGFRGIFICNSIHRDNCILNTDIYIQTRVISLLTEFFLFSFRN